MQTKTCALLKILLSSMGGLYILTQQYFAFFIFGLFLPPYKKNTATICTSTVFFFRLYLSPFQLMGFTINRRTITAYGGCHSNVAHRACCCGSSPRGSISRYQRFVPSLHPSVYRRKVSILSHCQTIFSFCFQYYCCCSLDPPMYVVLSSIIIVGGRGKRRAHIERSMAVLPDEQKTPLITRANIILTSKGRSCLCRRFSVGERPPS